MTLSELVSGLLKELEKNIAHSVQRAAGSITETINTEIGKIKRWLLLYILEIALYMLGAVFLLAGAIVFLSRFFSVELVFLGIGALAVYIALLLRLLRR